MSPRELHHEIEAQRLIHQDAANAQIVQAWRIEEIRIRTRNNKRMPDLRTLLIGLGPRTQSRAEQHDALLTLAAQYGLTVETVDEPTDKEARG